MMSPDLRFSGPVRVSILERLVPSLAFAVAAISGAVGAMMIFRFFEERRQAASAGYAGFFSGVAEIEMVMVGMLVFAAVLCGVGILVSLIRLFTTNATSSPPGILFLATGLLSLVPPFAIHYILHWMKGIVASPDPAAAGISSVADTITSVIYVAIGSTVFIGLILLAFTFVPFKSQPGRKVSPLVFLILVEILIATLVGVYIWETRASLIEREKDRAEQYSRPSEFENPPADNSTNDAPEHRTGDSGVEISNSGQSKTISGGVLNGQAIDLPQPSYPPAARTVSASGAVSVQVTVDEKGEVISAQALSGHPLLRAAAVQAARRARFAPATLAGQPVKVSGVITYNFSVR